MFKLILLFSASHSSKAEDLMEEEDGHAQSGEEEEEEAGSGVDSLEELQKRRSIQSGRGVTLSMLMSDGILEAGEGFLTIDYLVRNNFLYIQSLLKNYLSHQFSSQNVHIYLGFIPHVRVCIKE